FTKNSAPWKIRGKEGHKTRKGQTTWRDIESICRIEKSEKKFFLGKERIILTTECITKNASSSTIRIETYAVEIGLVERILKRKTNDGKVIEIHRFTLDKIQKTGITKTNKTRTKGITH
ncbi:hypothetical protein ACFL9T_22720, partial [Thermodesulfobacteriota bacterium]